MNKATSHSKDVDKKFRQSFVVDTFKREFVGKGRILRPIHLGLEDFDVLEKNKKRYWIVGFDTEYQSTTFEPYTIQELRENPSLSDREILSYQYSVLTDDGVFYNGIVYPDEKTLEDGKVVYSSSFSNEGRLAFQDFVHILLGDGVRNYHAGKVPPTLYFVGHFNRADLPTFSNIDELSKRLDSLRGTFMSMKGSFKDSINVAFPFEDSHEPVFIKISMRDTITLTPNLRSSLEGLGEVLGFNKIKLHDNPLEERKIKERMKTFMLEHQERFEEYALRDSDICAKYLKEMIDLYQDNTSMDGVPFTLSQIGTQLLLEKWQERDHEYKEKDPSKKRTTYLDWVLGKESIKDKYWNKRSSSYTFFEKKEFISEIYFSKTLVTECFHGGRNEQFFFGVSKEDSWFDWDLTSAYPTSMSLLGLPAWEERYSIDTEDLYECLVSPHEMIFAQVRFKFPRDVRFPCLPVRGSSGPIFPLEGVSFASAPELYLARQLGATFDVIQGCSVPVNHKHKPFKNFITYTISKRDEAKKVFGVGSMKEVFWKEMTNSVYGKTAQGMGFKRRYDLRDRQSKDLEESKITQPFFAAHITSFVRATLAEILNKVPTNKEVFSVTTDGFISNLDEEGMRTCCNGRLMKDYTSMVKELRGANSEALEVKHRARKLLGWRTRGQSTLIQDVDEKPILARAGIQAPPEYDTDELKRQFINERFFTRQPDTTNPNSRPVGIRDMVEGGEGDFDIDFTFVGTNKILNMEFDWKRVPTNPREEIVELETPEGLKEFKQVSFYTRPWNTVDECERFRNTHASWFKQGVYNIKTMKDLDDLVVSYNNKFHAEKTGQRKMYTYKDDNDVKRLKTDICIAYKRQKCGFEHGGPMGFTDEFRKRLIESYRQDFDGDGYKAMRKVHKLTDGMIAEYLSEILNVKVTKDDVGNGKRSEFIPHRCRRSKNIIRLLERIKEDYPSLVIEDFLQPEFGEDEGYIAL